MKHSIIELPPPLERAIEQLVNNKPIPLQTIERLHVRYQQREKGSQEFFLESWDDALAYLALRFPATYAQIYGAAAAVRELLPDWHPRSMLDIGAGPGTGLWATQAVWPNLKKVDCVEVNSELIQLGKQILESSDHTAQVTWEHTDVRSAIGIEKKYDLVLIANALNELESNEREKLIARAWNLCQGVLLIIEPGTEGGNTLVQAAAQRFADSGNLIAPYIAHSFVSHNNYWLHFPQRFTRPEFLRRVRQKMRDSSEMASDWEEAKYCYVAVSRIEVKTMVWGRAIGPIKKQKGFLEIPVLTKETITQIKVMKRHKKQYNVAKELQWGDLITHQEDIIFQL